MSPEYWELGKMDEMQVCKTGYVTEWTYQIDDEEYWRTLPIRIIDPNVVSVCPMPMFRRSQAMRCEYLVMGSSYLPKATNTKNSKPATWINADQGFRCVMDYGAAVRRHMRKANGH